MAVAEATCQNGRPTGFWRVRELQTPAPEGSIDRSFHLFGKGRGMPSSDNWHLYSAAGRWLYRPYTAPRPRLARPARGGHPHAGRALGSTLTATAKLRPAGRFKGYDLCADTIASATQEAIDHRLTKCVIRSPRGTVTPIGGTSSRPSVRSNVDLRFNGAAGEA